MDEFHWLCDIENPEVFRNSIIANFSSDVHKLSNSITPVCRRSNIYKPSMLVATAAWNRCKIFKRCDLGQSYLGPIPWSLWQTDIARVPYCTCETCQEIVGELASHGYEQSSEGESYYQFEFENYVYSCHSAAEYPRDQDMPEVNNGSKALPYCDAHVHVRRRKRRCTSDSTPAGNGVEGTRETWYCEGGLLWEWDGPEEVLLDETQVLREMASSHAGGVDAVANRSPSWHNLRGNYAHVTSVGISPDARWLTYQVTGCSGLCVCGRCSLCAMYARVMSFGAVGGPLI